jgi:hypothetical protein
VSISRPAGRLCGRIRGRPGSSHLLAGKRDPTQEQGSTATYASVARRISSSASEGVCRALDAAPPSVQHMRVNHRRLHAAMPQELLHRPDVIPRHQEMRGEAVSKGVDGRRLDDPRVASCPFERPLKGSQSRHHLSPIPPDSASPRLSSVLARQSPAPLPASGKEIGQGPDHWTSP